MGAEGIANTVINSFAMFYYNQVLGLSATLAGLAMTVGILLDGIIDPLIGSLSDRSTSRLGRRRSFILIAALPAGLCLIALFNPPPGLPSLGLFAWFTATIICLRVFVSLFQVPLLALGGELSANYLERSRIMASGVLAGVIGMAVAGFVALSVFLHGTPRYAQGLFNPDGYRGLSIATAGVVVLLLAGCLFGTRGALAARTAPSNISRQRLGTIGSNFLGDFWMALRNRNYLFLLLGLFVISFMTGVRNSLTVYVNTYFWGLTSEEFRWFSIWNLISAIFCLIGTRQLHQWIGKRMAMVWSTLLAGLLVAAPVVLKLTGIFPASHSEAWLPLQLVFSAAATGALATLSATALSAIADIADENEIRFGIRQEGVLYAARTFFSKVDTAIGALVAGELLTVIGFKPGMTATTAPAGSIDVLAIIVGPLAILPALVAAVFYGQFSITAAVHERIRTARRTTNNEPPPENLTGA